MALSQTSLDIELLTVGTLYNKGLLVSSRQPFVPIVSSFGAFYKWTNEPINSIFQPLFENYSSAVEFQEAISSIQLTYNRVSSPLIINNLNALFFISTSYSTLNAFSNMGISTLNSLNAIYNSNSINASLLSTTIKENYTILYPGVSSIVPRFYSTLFIENASSIIQSSIFLYIPRERIEEFTYSIGNPFPLLGGNFGSNIPLPWYWKDVPPGYIGPGMSSISTNFNDPNGIFYTDININFPFILDSISSGWYSSNSSLDIYRQNMYLTVSNAPNYIDGGSSISTLYEDIKTSFTSTLEYVSTFGDLTSTISSFIVSSIYNTSPPTLDGFSISQFISTGSAGIDTNQNGLIVRLNNAMSTIVLAIPLSTFSTSVTNALTSTLNYIDILDFIPGLNILSTVLQSTLKPFYVPLNVSTNFIGYEYLSSVTLTPLSSFSTNIGLIFGQGTFENLSTINSGISSLSTSIVVNDTLIYGAIYPYITGPGVSSMAADLSTNTTVTFIDYSYTLSSIITSFSNYLTAANSVPGISSLFSTAFAYNSTIVNTISTTYKYVQIDYFNEKQAVLDTNTDIITQINKSINNFISSGITAYTSSAIRFHSLSSITNNYSTYISEQAHPGSQEVQPGEIEQYINSFSSLQTVFLSNLDPFQGSTLYYKMLRTIPHYSTSLYAKDDTLITGPSWIERSTFFHSISTSTVTTATTDYIVSSLTVNMVIPNSNFNLNMQGSMYLSSATAADFFLPNFQIYNNQYPIPENSLQSLVTYNSTMTFNSNILTLKRIYNRIPFSYMGINTVNPGYSVDIAVGEARKPSGTAWITVSDRRIKEEISSPDIKVLAEQISSLRLVSYNWSEPYRSTLHLGFTKTLGFISQEVEKILPGSVYEKDEYGFSNFKSLDTDQLYKAKFGLTQDLLNRVSSLNMRVINLLKES
jgi:hypothetical protein